jgi:uncharacterized protein YggE
MRAAAIMTMLGGLASCQPQPHTILVQGMASAEHQPDYVDVAGKIEDVAPTTDEAASKSAKRMGDIVNGLKTAGFANDVLTASGFNLSPHCTDDYDSGRRVRHCEGFEAVNGIAVHLKDLSKTGLLLSTLAKLGVSDIEEPQFGLSDDAALEAQVRAAAIANAQATATAYAQKLGATVGKVVHTEEARVGESYFTRYGPGHSRPEAVAMLMASQAPRDVPVTIQPVARYASVYVEYELK